MRDVLLITFVLIFLFVLLGVMYNLTAPYLAKPGAMGNGVGVQSDGGIFRSLDFAHSWEQSVNAEDNKAFAKSSVLDVRFDMADSNSLYIATSSGLYKTQDSGNKWFRIISGALGSGEAVQSFTQDPKNSQRMYVASYDGERGHILKSRGKDFYEVYSTSKEGDRVLGVWVDSFDPATIYAGTKEGLFLESKDFGESWKIKKDFGDAVYDLEMLHSNTKHMYAVVGSGKIFKSTNRGKSWRDISAPFAKYGINFVVNQFLVDPHNENRIHIASSVGFLKSENAGAGFSKVSLLADKELPQVSAVAVDAQRANIIYIGVNNQIHKSDDGGENWQIKTLDTSRKVSVIRVKPDDSKIIFVGAKQ